MQIEYLADHPELIPTLARWHFAEWNGLVPGWSYPGAISDLESHHGRGSMPETLVAIAGSEVLGSVSLLAQDLPDLPPYTPWLASLFVAPDHRGRGVGHALVARVIEDARTIGADRLHLLTTDAERFYTRLGFQVLDRLEYQGFSAAILGLTLAGSPTPSKRS